MRVLILGGDGMLGHQLVQQLRPHHDIRITLRRELSCYESSKLFSKDNSYPQVDARSTDRLKDVIGDCHPEAIINAIGIVKQRADASEYLPSLEVNALFPHRLAALCKVAGARLIHISTDCVFSGNRGSYAEQDLSDAEDLYGKSKFLGELHEGHTVTLRTSMIGLELSRKTGLIEWFLAQKGKIRGFRKAIYSGLTTAEMVRVIDRILTRHPDISGVWHIASVPINKRDLLCMLAKKLGRTDLSIEPDDSFVCDRSLDATCFSEATGYESPGWSEMLEELAEQIRRREGKQ